MSDEIVLSMLGGATFGPEATLALPSGTTLNSLEANVFTAMYDRPETEDSRDWGIEEYVRFDQEEEEETE